VAFGRGGLACTNNSKFHEEGGGNLGNRGVIICRKTRVPFRILGEKLIFECRKRIWGGGVILRVTSWKKNSGTYLTGKERNSRRNATRCYLKKKLTEGGRISGGKRLGIFHKKAYCSGMARMGKSY